MLVVAAYVMFGIGFGMVNAPITNTAVSGMPLAQAGVAAAVASTSRQVGSALGVAVLGSLVTARLGEAFAVPNAMGADFAAAARPAWVVVGLRARRARAGPAEHDGAGQGDRGAHRRAVRRAAGARTGRMRARVG